MGIGQNAGVVHLIDFGLSKQFRDPNTHRHIPFITTHGVIGTAAFTSIHSHFGQELGRRDDLESLAYILIYFLLGSLPWQNSDSDSEEDESVLDIKQRIPANDLCRGLPVEFCIFLKYAQSLSFDAKPDYGYLRGLFEGLLSREGLQNDSFDWDNGGLGQVYGEKFEVHNKSSKCHTME
jgi:serine/threonine protein kinase